VIVANNCRKRSKGYGCSLESRGFILLLSPFMAQFPAFQSPPEDGSELDLSKAQEYALEVEDLIPLLQTLLSSLAVERGSLALALHSRIDHQAHRHLHSLKGMASMFCGDRLRNDLTRADNLARQQPVLWTELLECCQQVNARLDRLVNQVEALLRRYDSGC